MFRSIVLKNLGIIDSLDTIAETVKKYGLSPKKNLGQNFLFDLSLTRKIARGLPHLGVKDRLIEIGPGPGSLTRALILECNHPLTVLEKDERCLPALRKLQETYPALDIMHSDALDFDYADLVETGHRLHITGNLPYNIATELFVKWCQYRSHIGSMVLMFQKEVAERILSPEGQKSYGRLSVLAQSHFTCVKLFDIGSSAFYPAPKVTSSVVRFTPLKTNDLTKEQVRGLQQLTKLAFSQRRKMLRSTLKPLGLTPQDLIRVLDQVGIKDTDRAESVSVTTYINLMDLLLKKGLLA